MALGRRSFLVGGTVALAGVAGWRLLAAPPRASARSALGPLRPDPAGLLDLPEGFSYRVLEKSGAPMSDGYLAPILPDGMGCFSLPDGKLALLRNHEIPDAAGGAYSGALPREAYRPNRAGGVTRVVVDPKTFERVSSNLVLTGTHRNCAGGHSPWGWLSCEESTEPGHGYVFLCDVTAERVQPPRRIPGYGRFFHEAAAVDPKTLVAYLTEDRADGALYRFMPGSTSTPFEGRLQALRVRGKPSFDTSTRLRIGDRLEVEWVELPEPDPAEDTVRAQARAHGAAVVVRGEGICFADGAVTFCSTSGGPASAGQVFRLEPEGDGGTLALLAQSENTSTLRCPDNVTVAPWGEVYVAEDPYPFGRPFLRGVTDEGEVFDLARNALSGSEFAGLCFSPDGRAMFVNLHMDGLTLAVTGPFPAARA